MLIHNDPATLMRDMLPPPETEPPVPEALLPAVRTGGDRLRRRRRSLIGVAAVATATLLAGGAAGALALASDDGGTVVTGPAAQPTSSAPPTGPPSTSPGPQVPWRADDAVRLAHDRLLAALRAQLPVGVATIEEYPHDVSLSYLATRTDGQKLTVSSGVGSRHAPGSAPESPCESDPGINKETGGPLPAWTDCVRGILPDGSKTVTGSRTVDGDTIVELLITTPNGTARSLRSGTRNDRTGVLLGGPPLTGGQLFTLASQPDILSTITGSPSDGG
ncbi:hypothetical protein [Embleya scabrispora]|uniref:hypothetical protein n=1 Tax=Embleya scabrispora TaxID=159449 RepID=UPI00131A4767|nr:hypothetical protein [Embleya scabrispora]MYS87493.1 hypothetical protein [Streptomyces sp. SID5474]